MLERFEIETHKMSTPFTNVQYQQIYQNTNNSEVYQKLKLSKINQMFGF